MVVVTKYRYLILFASLYAFFVFSFALMSVPPVIPSITQEFNVSGATAGLLMSMAVVPGVILSLYVGIFIERHGVRMIGIFSSVLVALGCFIPTLGSFDLMLVGRLILGCGAAITLTAAPFIIPAWFPHQELGKAMGIYVTAMPIGTTLSFLFANITLPYGWRYLLYVATAMAIVNIATFSIIVKKGPIEEKSTQDLGQKSKGMRRTLRNFEIWKVGIVWALFSCAMVSFTTWAPTILPDFGINQDYANIIISALWLVQIPGCMIFGWISDRSKKRRPLMIMGCLTMLIILTSLSYTSNIALIAALVLLLGFLGTMIPPNVMASPAEILEPASVAIGFGILTIGQMSGITVGPPLVGLVLGSPRLSLMEMALFSAIGLVFAYFLKMK